MDTVNKEKAALERWVMEGNSVHENGSMAYTEQGTPCDFLEAYRYEEEIRSDLAGLSKKGQENYLAHLRGGDTIDGLRDELNRLIFKTRIYERVLREHHLLAEADIRIATAKDEQIRLEQQINEWILNSPQKELPFD